ncbi:hypothetical protein ACHAXR_010057 [Thalassiosira sp. AJA248-18]
MQSIAAAVNSSKWAVLILILTAATTYGSVYRNHKNTHILVNGWSLPTNTSPFLSRHANIVGIANGGHSLHLALSVSGGGAEDENDDNDTFMASETDGEESTDDSTCGENAMKELRKKWSDITSFPTVAGPVATDAMLGDDPSETATLGDFDSDKTLADDKRTNAIIIMDGFSPFHGQYLANVARHVYGAAVIHVLSDFMTRYLYQVEQQTDHLSSRLPDLEKGDEVEAWSSLLSPSLDICGIYCESDSGLEDAEKLGVALGLYPRCHDGVNNARRDKFLMNQVVSEVGGLDVVKQKSCQTLDEAEVFAKGLGLCEEDNDTLVVVKPLRGVASDDVHLCSDLPSLRKAFTKILQSPIFGSSTAAQHEQVLVQEFATGVEYAIDIVCRDGERKAAALWRYDKRAVNGAPFVYFSTQLASAGEEDEVEKEVCKYAFDALDALGIRWGLSHVEVIAETSPETGNIRVRLVEVNCRQHNTDFIPLTNACVGYNALDMVLAAHLGNKGDENSSHNPLQWDSIPALPTTRAYGAIVHFVSHVEGNISCIRHDVLEEIDSLASVMDMHVYPQFLEVGNDIQKTIDIRSDTGWAHLMNDNKDEFQRDYERLVELMKDMFEVDEDTS